MAWGASTVRRLANEWNVSRQQVRQIGNRLDDSTTAQIAAVTLSDQPARIARQARGAADDTTRRISRTTLGAAGIAGGTATAIGVGRPALSAYESRQERQQTEVEAEDREDIRDIFQEIMAQHDDPEAAAAAFDGLNLGNAFGPMESVQEHTSLLDEIGLEWPSLFSFQGLVLLLVIYGFWRMAFTDR